MLCLKNPNITIGKHAIVLKEHPLKQKTFQVLGKDSFLKNWRSKNNLSLYLPQYLYGCGVYSFILYTSFTYSVKYFLAHSVVFFIIGNIYGSIHPTIKSICLSFLCIRFKIVSIDIPSCSQNIYCVSFSPSIFPSSYSFIFFSSNFFISVV